MAGKLTLLMIVVMIWIQAGFATVVLSAAIKAVPAETVEAAKIDGATNGQAFRRVVIPNIRPTIIVVLVTISVATLKVFDLVQTFGADRYDGDTLANQMYTTYKHRSRRAAARRSASIESSALAMVIFLLRHSVRGLPGAPDGEARAADEHRGSARRRSMTVVDRPDRRRRRPVRRTDSRPRPRPAACARA